MPPDMYGVNVFFLSADQLAWQLSAVLGEGIMGINRCVEFSKSSAHIQMHCWISVDRI